MNAKKCKAIRKAIRQDIKANSRELPEDGLLYKDTRKILGFRFPQGWTKERLQRLAVSGGPWYNEALRHMKPVFARQAINVPGSFRAVYRKTKRVVADGSTRVRP